MSFILPYEKLTPIMGKDAQYDPKIETTPEFMNNKFKELLENDIEAEKQINDLNDNKANKDTLVILWSGNVTDGDITLTETITNFYKIDICTQPFSGYGYTPYTLDRGPYVLQTSTKYSIPIGTDKGLDIMFSADGLTATVSNNTGLLRRIIGYKGGR